MERAIVLFCFIYQYYYLTELLFQDIKGYRAISLLSESHIKNLKGSKDQLIG